MSGMCDDFFRLSFSKISWLQTLQDEELNDEYLLRAFIHAAARYLCTLIAFSPFRALAMS